MFEAKPLRLVTIITDRNKGKKVVNLLNDYQIMYHIAMLGKGTAHTEMAAYSGLGEPEKAVILCITEKENVQGIFNLMKEEMHFDKQGMGIAFSSPINSASCMDVLKYLSDQFV